MSKHRHRDRLRNNENHYYNNNNRYGPINNNPFGISPNQLLNLLGGNFNMNNLSNILSSMNRDGFDLNSLNNTMNNNFNTSNDTNVNFSDNNDNKESDENNINDNLSNMEESVEEKVNSIYTEDENLLLLLSLKNIVDPKKFEFIDKIISLYKNGKIK